MMLFLHLGFRAPPHATVPSAILGGSGSGRCSGSVPVAPKKSCGRSVERVSLWSVDITSVRDHGPCMSDVPASKSTPVNASATRVEPQSPQIGSAIPMAHTRSTAAPAFPSAGQKTDLLHVDGPCRRKVDCGAMT